MIEKEEIINNRAREILVKYRLNCYSDNSRPTVAKKISNILGRHIPTTTYTGYETNRNAPLEVKLAICELYELPLYMVMGLEDNPDDQNLLRTRRVKKAS